jgi:hypothetical protein
MWVVEWRTIKPDNYTFEPQGRPGSFDPIITRYSKLVEVIVGLAAGSIVLLAGSNGFRNGAGVKLPPEYASPLMLLAMSVVFSVMFVALCSHNYEEWQHHCTYTHHRFRFSVALGFSGLICFALGYCWLGYAFVTH